MLKSDNLWWHDPVWLIEKNQYPLHREPTEVNLPEIKTVSVALVAVTTEQILQKYSSYSKLCRVIAYCHKFASNQTIPKKTGPLELEKLNKAERTIAR